jgi:hypothetical protein
MYFTDERFLGRGGEGGGEILYMNMHIPFA